MDKNILGCNIDFRAYESTTKAIKKTLADSRLLSEVGEISGVPASTVQNWVKRRYISSPDGKKYSAEQIADIILLNNMKNAVELTDASELINSTKKKVGITSVEILGILSSALIRAKRFNSTDRESLKSVINIELRNEGKDDRALAALIMIIALSSLSADYKRLACEEMNTL